MIKPLILINKIRKSIFAKNYNHWEEGCADPLAFPRIVHIENTNACPARCVICSMEEMTRRVGVMHFDLFGVLIRECARRPEISEVHLHGFGEPLVDKDLPKKVALAKQLGIPATYTVTNAFLLTEKMAEDLISAGLDGIKFSFYGMTKDTYERVHKNLKFETTIRNIEGFFRVRDRLKALTPAVKFQFCPDLAPVGELEMFLTKWKDYMDADRGDLFYNTGLHNWAGNKDYVELKVPGDKRFCSLPFRDIQILWDGRVVPCIFDYDGTVILGDVNKSTIAEIWSSAKFGKFREVWLNKKSSSIALCAKCDIPDGTFKPRSFKEKQPHSRGIVKKRKKLLYRLSRLRHGVVQDIRLYLRNFNGNTR